MQDKEGEYKNNDGGIVDKCDICYQGYLVNQLIQILGFTQRELNNELMRLIWRGGGGGKHITIG